MVDAVVAVVVNVVVDVVVDAVIDRRVDGLVGTMAEATVLSCTSFYCDILSQEFNKLLMSLLERCLQRSAPPLRTLVSGLFCGELAYVTRCLTCKTSSRNRNAFNDMELQIGVREMLFVAREGVSERFLVKRRGGLGA